MGKSWNRLEHEIAAFARLLRPSDQGEEVPEEPVRRKARRAPYQEQLVFRPGEDSDEVSAGLVRKQPTKKTSRGNLEPGVAA
jgi:hypothetical protein